MSTRELTIGFVGNPNCGKTTLFNAYTGANLKVANWPGDEKLYTDYFIWQAVFRLSAIFDIISIRLICKISVAGKLYKMIDTKYDTTYNIDRRYSECQSGINY